MLQEQGNYKVELAQDKIDLIEKVIASKIVSLNLQRYNFNSCGFDIVIQNKWKIINKNDKIIIIV